MSAPIQKYVAALNDHSLKNTLLEGYNKFDHKSLLRDTSKMVFQQNRSMYLGLKKKCRKECYGNIECHVDEISKVNQAARADAEFWKGGVRLIRSPHKRAGPAFVLML